MVAMADGDEDQRVVDSLLAVCSPKLKTKTEKCETESIEVVSEDSSRHFIHRAPLTFPCPHTLRGIKKA